MPVALLATTGGTENVVPLLIKEFFPASTLFPVADENGMECNGDNNDFVTVDPHPPDSTTLKTTT